MKRSWSSTRLSQGSFISTTTASSRSISGSTCACSAVARGTSTSAPESAGSSAGSTVCWPSHALMTPRSCSSFSTPDSTSNRPSKCRWPLCSFACWVCSAACNCSCVTSPWLTSAWPRWRSVWRGAAALALTRSHSACGLVGRSMGRGVLVVMGAAAAYGGSALHCACRGHAWLSVGPWAIAARPVCPLGATAPTRSRW